MAILFIVMKRFVITKFTIEKFENNIELDQQNSEINQQNLKELNDVEAVWITKNKKVLKILKEKGLPVAFAYSINGIVFCLRAKFIFTTHGKNDINPALTCGCIHIELYHFVIALKKLRYDVINYYMV